MSQRDSSSVVASAGPSPGRWLSADNWPSFRGPGAIGVAEGAAAPTSWDVPDNKGVKWRVAVPGLAHSSPDRLGQSGLHWPRAVSSAASASLKVGLYGDIESANDQRRIGGW